jgi:hypothetical protein
MMKFSKPDMRFVNEQDAVPEYREESFIRVAFSLQSVIGHQLGETAYDDVMLVRHCLVSTYRDTFHQMHVRKDYISK